MPTLSVDFTAAQATRIAAALGVSSQAEVEAEIKAWLKGRVIAHEQQVAANTAYDAARAQAETDFA